MKRARRLMDSTDHTEDEAEQLRADRDQVSARARVARRLSDRMREQADNYDRTAGELETMAQELAETADRWEAEERGSDGTGLNK